jgi:hypothetical protein
MRFTKTAESTDNILPASVYVKKSGNVSMLAG